MPLQSPSPGLAPMRGGSAPDGPTGPSAVMPMLILLVVILAIIATVVLFGAIWASAIAALGTACMAAFVMLWVHHLPG
jgi:hypothetical protein